MAKAATNASALQRLRARLEEAEETIQAIRRGEVDAVVVSGPDGEQIYTLRGADHSYRVLLEDMNEGAATLLPDGSVLYCNRAFADMLKMPIEKVIGFSIDEVIDPSDRQTFEGLLRQGEHAKARAEIAFHLNNRTIIPAYCSISSVQIDDLRCLCLTVTDLTEQKRREAIVAAEKLARSIIEQSVDVIVVCDESGTIIRASDAAQELSGTNVLHRRFEQVFPLTFKDGTGLTCTAEPETPGSFSIAACLGGHTLQSVEVELRRPDGKKFDLLLSAGPLRDSQHVLGCLFTLRDITQRKRFEEELRQSEERFRQQAQELEQQLIASGRLVSLGEITASMAHEFNNPLGIVMGFTQDLMSETDPSHPHYRSLKIIDEETKRCEKIIRDLLQFARPKSTDLCPTDVKQIIEKTVGLVANHLYKQKIDAVMQLEEPLPKIHADPQELEQVLVNLYLNAVDAMPDGGRLTVGGKVSQGAPGIPQEVVITVSDTGFGISSEDLPKIFQPFFTARKKSGMGLGLPICDRIIKNHGGRIIVNSQPGQGTTFEIFLPIAQ
ncbi:MAG TPA: ATP-binding protein [Candidatus Binatia bacterium]